MPKEQDLQLLQQRREQLDKRIASRQSIANRAGFDGQVRFGQSIAMDERILDFKARVRDHSIISIVEAEEITDKINQISRQEELVAKAKRFNDEKQLWEERLALFERAATAGDYPSQLLKSRQQEYQTFLTQADQDLDIALGQRIIAEREQKEEKPSVIEEAPRKLEIRTVPEEEALPQLLFDPRTGQVEIAGRRKKLNQAERRLLTILANVQGQEVERQQIICQPEIQAVGYALHTIVWNLRSKIELDPKNPRFLLLRRVGRHGALYKLENFINADFSEVVKKIDTIPLGAPSVKGLRWLLENPQGSADQWVEFMGPKTDGSPYTVRGGEFWMTGQITKLYRRAEQQTLTGIEESLWLQAQEVVGQFGIADAKQFREWIHQRFFPKEEEAVTVPEFSDEEIRILAANFVQKKALLSRGRINFPSLKELEKDLTGDFVNLTSEQKTDLENQRREILAKLRTVVDQGHLNKVLNAHDHLIEAFAISLDLEQFSSEQLEKLYDFLIRNVDEFVSTDTTAEEAAPPQAIEIKPVEIREDREFGSAANERYMKTLTQVFNFDERGKLMYPAINNLRHAIFGRHSRPKSGVNKQLDVQEERIRRDLQKAYDQMKAQWRLTKAPTLQRFLQSSIFARLPEGWQKIWSQIARFDGNELMLEDIHRVFINPLMRNLPRWATVEQRKKFLGGHNNNHKGAK